MRAAFRKAHISELLNVEPVDDPTEDLLPEEIYASYLQDPTRETQEEIKFKVYGTAEEQNILLKLLHQYSDVFSDKLGRGAATVTPMKIEVDEAGWYNDKRSREPSVRQADHPLQYRPERGVESGETQGRPTLDGIMETDPLRPQCSGCK